MKIVSHSTIKSTCLSHDPSIMKNVILGSGIVDNITQVSETIMQPDQATTEHVHSDMSEIYSFAEGVIDFSIDGTVSSVEGPATVVIHPGELHSICNASGTTVVLRYTGVLASERAI